MARGGRPRAGCGAVAVSVDDLAEETLGLTEPGRFFGDVLDVASPEAVVLVVRVADDCALIALETSPDSIESACQQAADSASHCATLTVTEVSEFLGYGSHWSATLGRQLPAFCEGVTRFTVEFDADPVPVDGPSPAPTALPDLIGRLWSIDSVRQARIRRPQWSTHLDFEAPILAWLLSVHRAR